jgi:hypothetical protein
LLAWPWRSSPLQHCRYASPWPAALSTWPSASRGRATAPASALPVRHSEASPRGQSCEHLPHVEGAGVPSALAVVADQALLACQGPEPSADCSSRGTLASLGALSLRPRPWRIGLHGTELCQRARSGARGAVRTRVLIVLCFSPAATSALGPPAPRPRERSRCRRCPVP